MITLQSILPINYLRNVGINITSTQYYIMNDVDLLPSPGLYEQLITYTENLLQGENTLKVSMPVFLQRNNALIHRIVNCSKYDQVKISNIVINYKLIVILYWGKCGHLPVYPGYMTPLHPIPWLPHCRQSMRQPWACHYLAHVPPRLHQLVLWQIHLIHLAS